MVEVLCVGVVIAGAFALMLAAWLVHVAHREAHLFRLHWLGNGGKR